MWKAYEIVEKNGSTLTPGRKVRCIVWCSTDVITQMTTCEAGLPFRDRLALSSISLTEDEATRLK